jgi:hypothetical protein
MARSALYTADERHIMMFLCNIHLLGMLNVFSCVVLRAGVAVLYVEIFACTTGLSWTQPLSAPHTVQYTYCASTVLVPPPNTFTPVLVVGLGHNVSVRIRTVSTTRTRPHRSLGRPCPSLLSSLSERGAGIGCGLNLFTPFPSSCPI